jgi:hypothetical protein
MVAGVGGARGRARGRDGGKIGQESWRERSERRLLGYFLEGAVGVKEIVQEVDVANVI